MKTDDIKTYQSQKNWISIIKSLKGPISFFGLVVLAFQIILLAIIYKSDSSDSDLLFILSSAIVILPIIAVSFAYFGTKGSTDLSSANEFRIEFEDGLINLKKLRLFLTTPMSGYGTEKEYKNFKDSIINIIKEIREFDRIEKIYYINENIPSLQEFEKADLSVPEYFNEIAHCDYFILIVEEPSLSSVYFESGYALGKGKKCIFFVRDNSCLPYLMKHTAFAYSRKVRIYEYESYREIVKVLKSKETYL